MQFYFTKGKNNAWPIFNNIYFCIHTLTLIFCSKLCFHPHSNSKRILFDYNSERVIACQKCNVHYPYGRTYLFYKKKNIIHSFLDLCVICGYITRYYQEASFEVMKPQRVPFATPGEIPLVSLHYQYFRLFDVAGRQLCPELCTVVYRRCTKMFLAFPVPHLLTQKYRAFRPVHRGEHLPIFATRNNAWGAFKNVYISFS